MTSILSTGRRFWQPFVLSSALLLLSAMGSDDASRNVLAMGQQLPLPRHQPAAAAPHPTPAEEGFRPSIHDQKGKGPIEAGGAEKHPVHHAERRVPSHPAGHRGVRGQHLPPTGGGEGRDVEAAPRARRTALTLNSVGDLCDFYTTTYYNSYYDQGIKEVCEYQGCSCYCPGEQCAGFDLSYGDDCYGSGFQCRHPTAAEIGAQTGCTRSRSLRLVGGGDGPWGDGCTHDRGRLEIFSAGRWGTVCDDGFDDDAATVVCKEMFGANATGKATTGGHYGQGYGPILQDYTLCLGTEHRLEDCPIATVVSMGDANCVHDEDVGVRCYGGEWIRPSCAVDSTVDETCMTRLLPDPSASPTPSTRPTSSPQPTAPTPSPSRSPYWWRRSYVDDDDDWWRDDDSYLGNQASGGSDEGQGQGLGGASIVGIVAGSALGVGLVLLAALRVRRQKRQGKTAQNGATGAGCPAPGAGQQVLGNVVNPLHAKAPPGVSGRMVVDYDAPFATGAAKPLGPTAGGDASDGKAAAGAAAQPLAGMGGGDGGDSDSDAGVDVGSVMLSGGGPEYSNREWYLHYKQYDQKAVFAAWYNPHATIDNTDQVMGYEDIEWRRVDWETVVQADLLEQVKQSTHLEAVERDLTALQLRLIAEKRRVRKALPSTQHELVKGLEAAQVRATQLEHRELWYKAQVGTMNKVVWGICGLFTSVSFAGALSSPSSPGTAWSVFAASIIVPAFLNAAFVQPYFDRVGRRLALAVRVMVHRRTRLLRRALKLGVEPPPSLKQAADELRQELEEAGEVVAPLKEEKESAQGKSAASSTLVPGGMCQMPVGPPPPAASSFVTMTRRQVEGTGVVCASNPLSKQAAAVGMSDEEGDKGSSGDESDAGSDRDPSPGAATPAVRKGRVQALLVDNGASWR